MPIEQKAEEIVDGKTNAREEWTSCFISSAKVIDSDFSRLPQDWISLSSDSLICTMSRFDI